MGGAQQQSPSPPSSPAQAVLTEGVYTCVWHDEWAAPAWEKRLPREHRKCVYSAVL